MSWGERSCKHKPCIIPDECNGSSCNVNCRMYEWDGVANPDSKKYDDVNIEEEKHNLLSSVFKVSSPVEKKDLYLKDYVSINKNKNGKYVYIRAEPFRFGMQDGIKKLENNTTQIFVYVIIDGKKTEVPVSEKCMILYYAGFKFVMKKEHFKQLYRRV